MYKKTAIILSVCSMLIMSGCFYDKKELLYPQPPPVDCSTVPASFQANIFPLISTRCATTFCHSAASAEGGAVFTDYAKIKALAGRIRVRAVELREMPQDGTLTQEQINELRCWIDAGAPNN